MKVNNQFLIGGIAGGILIYLLLRRKKEEQKCPPCAKPNVNRNGVTAYPTFVVPPPSIIPVPNPIIPPPPPPPPWLVSPAHMPAAVSSV